jgi:SAM-dependent methyltransferase
LSECQILDIGCGNGSLLNWFQAEGAEPRNLVGIDLLPAQIEDARNKYPGLFFLEANAERLEFPDASFDVILAFTVFSSILDGSMARNVAQTIARILKRDGVIVWYDIRYPNPWNRNVQAMTKARIRRLFPNFMLDLTSITVLPPLTHRLGNYAKKAYPLLTMIPVFHSNYIGLLRSS